MSSIKIADIVYEFNRPKLKKSIEGVNFITKNYGTVLIDLGIKFKDADEEVTPELFQNALQFFHKDEGLIMKTFEFFFKEDFLKNPDQLEKNYEKHGLQHLIRLLWEIFVYNYFYFFLSEKEKKKRNY